MGAGVQKSFSIGQTPCPCGGQAIGGPALRPHDQFYLCVVLDEVREYGINATEHFITATARKTTFDKSYKKTTFLTIFLTS